MGEPVVTVWIDNPPLNVLTAEVAAGIRHELEQLDPETRVVVLRGRGERAFSAGADLSAVGASGGPPAGIQPLADTIEALSVPVVAAIHGHCLGGGLEVALACDLRIAHEGARLALPEVGLGLLPGGGGTQRLPRLIGPGRAAWLITTGEPLSAAQAEAWGLVELVAADLDEAVGRVAATLARRSPYALGEIKRLLRATRDKRSDRLELEAFDRCVASEDGREGVAAFLARREPRFTGR